MAKITAMQSSKIIDQLGGTNVVSRLCEVSAPSVSQWRNKGIPPARLMYLKVVRPDVFLPAKKTTKTA